MQQKILGIGKTSSIHAQKMHQTQHRSKQLHHTVVCAIIASLIKYRKRIQQVNCKSSYYTQQTHTHTYTY